MTVIDYKFSWAVTSFLVRQYHTLSITNNYIHTLLCVVKTKHLFCAMNFYFLQLPILLKILLTPIIKAYSLVATLLHGGSMTCCWFSGSLHPCWTSGSQAPRSHCWLHHSLLAPLLPSSLIQFWFLLAPWPPNHGSLLAPWLHADFLYPCWLLTGSLATGWLLGSLLAHC